MKKKRKTLIIIAVVVVAAGVAGLIALALSLNGVIRTGIETVGPRATGGSINVQRVDVSPFSGGGALRNLIVGNPEGFKTDSAFELAMVRVKLAPRSLLTDRIVIEEIIIDGPQITYEQGLRSNNISALVKNIQTFAGESEAAPQAEAQPGKKLQINHFVLRNGKIRLGTKLTGKLTMDLPLPQVELHDLGGDADGTSWAATLAEVAEAVSKAVLETVTRSGGVLQDAGQETLKTAKGLGKNVKDTAGRTLSGFKGLLGGGKKK